MLTKLIKYDIRSTWRDFAGVYLSILLGVMILPQIFNHFSSGIINLIAGFIAFGIAITTIVCVIAMLFRIYNTNVFSKEGYLTMTLPVTSAQVVVSKLIVSSMWIVVTGIVAAVGICIFALNMNAAPPSEILAGIRKLLSLLDSRGVLAVILIITAMVFSAVKEIAKLFLACSIAHLKQLSRFRVVAGILSYFVFSWMETLLIQAVGLILSLVPYGIELSRQIEMINNPGSIHKYIGLFSGVMTAGILYAAVLTILYGIATVAILDRKLDLD